MIPFLTGSLFAGKEIDTARVQEIAATLPKRPAGFGSPASNRSVWSELASSPGFAGVIASAEALAKKTTPELPDDLFLDYSKTGNRDRCQRVMSVRLDRLETFALAECLENKGRFIPPLVEVIAALCAERTWVYPAHDPRLNNFNGRTIEMDLRATALARDLANINYCLADSLPAATRKLIHEEVNRRVLVPFRDMVEGRRPEISWMRRQNNWNSVCLAGIAGTAIATLDSREERAWFIAAAEQYIPYFLKSFTPDGYCSEGLGYWNYGFGQFVMLAESVRQATGGKVDLFAEAAVLPPASFGSRVEVLNGIYPSIADADPDTRPNPTLMRYVAERCGLPITGNRREIFVRENGAFASTLMYTFLPEPLPAAQRSASDRDLHLRTWFPDGGVLICRPGKTSYPPFAAVLKGGHNAEQHNHNDVGSFSVIAGKTVLICDPGAEVYTSRTFSSRRYTSKVLSSYGHAVPMIAGELQRTGREARGKVLRADFSESQDVLGLDIKSAYDVAALKKLERTFVFKRGANAALSVTDDVAFSEPQNYVSALITWSDWKKTSDTELLIQEGNDAIRVRIDTGGEPFSISSEVLDEDVHSPRKPIRLAIALNAPVREASVKFSIVPEKN